jgi:hypothetical protein
VDTSIGHDPLIFIRRVILFREGPKSLTKYNSNSTRKGKISSKRFIEYRNWLGLALIEKISRVWFEKYQN